uniref:Uncharacterized protein n=1 Tax=Timema genevievae TaxID=629358 RepID=A0A7R9K179_TIMGE|nr:unnamed protein product [Timema genevievae]
MWVCREKHKSKVDAVGMRYLRNVCGETHMDRVSNEWGLKECGLKGNTMGQCERSVSTSSNWGMCPPNPPEIIGWLWPLIRK